jgi:hypothetical protein
MFTVAVAAHEAGIISLVFTFIVKGISSYEAVTASFTASKELNVTRIESLVVQLSLVTVTLNHVSVVIAPVEYCCAKPTALPQLVPVFLYHLKVKLPRLTPFGSETLAVSVVPLLPALNGKAGFGVMPVM